MKKTLLFGLLGLAVLGEHEVDEGGFHASFSICAQSNDQPW